MNSARIKSKRLQAAASSRVSSFVRYDAHPARWRSAVPGGLDLLGPRAAVQPPYLLKTFSEGDPGDRPAQIAEGAANVGPARPAHRGSVYFGFGLANRHPGKSLLLGSLRLCLRRAFHLQPR